MVSSHHPTTPIPFFSITPTFGSSSANRSSVGPPVLRLRPPRHSDVKHTGTGASANKGRAQSVLVASRQLLCLPDTKWRHNPAWDRHERRQRAGRQGSQGRAGKAGEREELVSRGSTQAGSLHRGKARLREQLCSKLGKCISKRRSAHSAERLAVGSELPPSEDPNRTNTADPDVISRLRFFCPLHTGGLLQQEASLGATSKDDVRTS